MTREFMYVYAGMAILTFSGFSFFINKAYENSVNRYVDGREQIRINPKSDGSQVVYLMGSVCMVCKDGDVVSMDTRLEKYPNQTQAICTKVHAMMKRRE